MMDHGPPDEPFSRPVKHRWHAIDAKHAVTVEPERYKFVEYGVSAEPHQPGYHAVTSEMIVGGFSAPMREKAAPPPVPKQAAEPEPETAPEDEMEHDRE